MDFINRTWQQRLGYGAADLACNLVWQMIALYLMFFYTDVVGLSAASVGTLFLVTRFIDAVTDVCMGFVIDRTRTRWGRSRPYFLWGALPFGLLAVLAFYAPRTASQGGLIYAYFTYIGLSAVYTVVNIPMASILPGLTSDARERTLLATTRIVFAFVGASIVGWCALPMVKYLGGGSQANGFLKTMLIFASTGTLLFLLSFFSIREKSNASTPKITLNKALFALRGNTQWYVFAVNILFMWGAFFLQMGAMVYYFTYNIGDPELGAMVAGIASFSPIFGTFLTPLFSRFLSKRDIFMLGSAIHLSGLLVMLFSGSNIPGLIVGALIAWVAHGLRQAIYFSMQADPVDYGEWKTGISAAGVMSAINGFIGKIAMALAGAVSGWTLTWAGYEAHAVQTPGALWAIRFNYLILPILLVVISMAIMTFYTLDRDYPGICSDLKARKQT